MTEASDPAELVTPEEAARVFGARLPLAQQYVDLLAGPGVERGLLGPREVPRLWDRHVLNCAVVAELVPPAARVADVGSGAGLPGLALALARPDLTVVLVEPLLRRATYLDEVVTALGLEGVTVRRSRAEDIRDLTVDVVTARAVAPTLRLAAWCLPLLRPGGQMLALKGASVRDELADAEPGLRRLGAETWEIVTVGGGVVDPPTTVLRVVLGDRPADRSAARSLARAAAPPEADGRPTVRGGRRSRGGRGADRSTPRPSGARTTRPDASGELRGEGCGPAS